jgi:hypothetical protein
MIRAHPRVLPTLIQNPDDIASENAARSERTARAVALPLALLFAWLAVKGSPGWPGPWFTPVSTERSPWFSMLLVGLLAYGGYRAWQLQRWFWIAASMSGMLLVLLCTLLLAPVTAQQLIVFGGDGGSLVLGTLLMFTVYA